MTASIRSGPLPSPMHPSGVVAAGHECTAEAARVLLIEGGNAFDAALGALAAACVAEPVLASLGGGGFLLARREDGREQLYDFFAQTPREVNREGSDFYPIHGDFGDAVQEFHVGLGSIAVPGVVRGLFEIHRELGRLPMRRVLEPAVRLAQEGVPHNSYQSYIEQILEPVLVATPAMRRLFPPHRSAFHNPELGDFLDALGREGDELFYRGEPARRLARDCAEGGGHLREADLGSYELIRRRPLVHRHRGASIYFNSPPSTGGALIAFSLRFLEATPPPPSPSRLVQAMRATDRARREAISGRIGFEEHLGENETLCRALAYYPTCTRGTTHISVADGRGNLASLTVSNGEASGYVLPGTGVLLNNFLGEEDLHPEGLERWPPDRRMASMMCPTLVERPDGRLVALGSGGSNRIRSAILQILLGILDEGLSLEAAVHRPRLHFERDHLDLEPGRSPELLAALLEEHPGATVWSDRNLYFGGAHAVEYQPSSHRFSGVGDPRRGGVCLTLR